jgi:hypothetical protein
MHLTSGAPLAPGELNPRLVRLIGEEVDWLKIKKHFYDQVYPEHAKDLSNSDLRRIARSIVIKRLSVPPETNEELEW